MPRPHAALLLALAASAACTTPDTEAGLDRFLGATEDARITPDAALPDATSGDFSGVYLLAVQTPLGGPILFEATVDVLGDAFDLTLQPLKTARTLEGDARPDAGDPAGESLEVLEIPLQDGSFTFAVAGLSILGTANPVTFQEIVADLAFTGVVLAPDAFCGTITGTLLVPVNFDLAGSTFAAAQGVSPTAPDVQVACP